MFGEFTLYKHLTKEVWRMDRSIKGLLIVTTDLDCLIIIYLRSSAEYIHS